MGTYPDYAFQPQQVKFVKYCFSIYTCEADSYYVTSVFFRSTLVSFALRASVSVLLRLSSACRSSAKFGRGSDGSRASFTGVCSRRRHAARVWRVKSRHVASQQRKTHGQKRGFKRQTSKVAMSTRGGRENALRNWTDILGTDADYGACTKTSKTQQYSRAIECIRKTKKRVSKRQKQQRQRAEADLPGADRTPVAPRAPVPPSFA